MTSPVPAEAERGPRLHVVPLTFEDACLFVDEWHRHHRRPMGHKFSLGVATDELVLVGVADVGRPVAASFQDGRTLEVNRTATDGTPNANSCLYGAAWRAAKALGWERLITYTQEGETGASLRAAGYRVLAERKPRGGWLSKPRPEGSNRNANVARTLWEAHP